ncbi:UDP-glucose 4-epimerase GalE [Oleispira antarctica]|uniref:UDP-glucose 4-epimerase n=1 Tax=Oleispira antarctica TaxID=188908 RepID=A0A1Y5HQ11_OLEAN|nr:UDP-glucose 4-epimerase GalE [Oleispira antarctica]
MILVTGGAGYIGSHTCIELLSSGYDVLVIDNLDNSSEESLKRVEELCGKKPAFIKGDVRDTTLMAQIFEKNDIKATIHFAGLKAVGESCEMPLEYYNNNVYSTLVLCQAMQNAGSKNLVFSSSATVYGDPEKLPLTEDMPLSATNPYGRSKLIIEDMLRDLPAADVINKEASNWSVALLRYFNPVGAHKSGRIGEDPSGKPNNLMPFITQTAVGRRDELAVFGSDYDTVDGTGVRDYIHVVDLAKGHVKAVEKLLSKEGIEGVQAYNLGTGNGISVLEMVKAFAKENDVAVPYKLVPRRPGDVAACYADATRARAELNWQAEFSLEDMVRDSWKWQSQNPEGYKA